MRWNKNIMKKPEIKTKHFYYYNDCIDYICKKYKVEEDEFWDYKSDHVMGNGSFISIDQDDLEEFETGTHGYEFVEKMIQEFGKDASYFVEW